MVSIVGTSPKRISFFLLLILCLSESPERTAKRWITVLWLCLSWPEFTADCTMKPRGIKAHFQTFRRSVSLHCSFAVLVISWFYPNICDLGGGHSLPMSPKFFSPARYYSTLRLTQPLWTLHIKEKSFFFRFTSKEAQHTWRKMSQL